MKSFSLIAILMFLVSCTSIPMKNSGKVASNGLPECSWDKPFTRCESSQDAKPLWGACPSGYRDIGLPDQGIQCIPINQPTQTIRAVKAR